jgi:flagellar basal body-associated protein FliL
MVCVNKKVSSMILFVILVMAVIPGVLALTASMGNARMILRPDVPEGDTVTIQKSIQVNNVNDIPIKVSLEPQNHYKKIIEIIDNDLTLQPGETTNARFKITLKSGGDYEGKIFVSFYPEDPASSSPPVGLSSTVIIKATGPVNDFHTEVMEETPTYDSDQDDPANNPLNEETDDDTHEDSNDDQDNNDNQDSTNTDNSDNDNNNDNDKNSSAGVKKSSGILGILIILVIVLVGVALFLMIFALIKKAR